MRAVGALAIVALVAPSAAADPWGEAGADSTTAPAAHEAPDVAGPPDSYVGEMLAMDALAIGATVASIQLERRHPESDAAMALGIPGWTLLAFGGPVLHGVHGHGMRAAASFGLHSAFSFLSVAVMSAANADCTGFLCGLDNLDYYFAAGMAAASLLDLAILSHGSTLISHAPPRTWSPIVAPLSGGASLGAAGRF